MSDLDIRAVLVGSLVDVVGSFFVAGIFFAVVGATAGASSPDQLGAMLDASLALQLATLVLGLLMTGIGAYVAAWMARGRERTHAFAVGVISTVVGFTIVFSAPDTSPFWSEATSLILTIPAAFAAGEVRRLVVARGLGAER